MHRIDTATADPDANGAGVAGFTDGNPGMAIPPTDLNASWFNTVQEELCNFITGQGISLTSAKTQLLAALRAPVGASGAAAISGTGGTSSGTGLKGTGGASNGIGVQGFGTGTGCGLEGSGASSPIATAATTGSGVVGRGGQTNGFGGEFFGKGAGAGVSSIGGSTNGVAFSGTGGGTNGGGASFIAVGTGAGVTGIAVDGYGVVATSDTTSPAKASLRLVPQDTDPATSPAAGDFYANTTTGKLGGYSSNTVWERYVPQSYASVATSTAITNTTTRTAFDKFFTVKANTLRAASTIRVSGNVHVDSDNASDTLAIDLYWGGASGTKLCRIFQAFDPGTGDWVSFEAIVTLRTVGVGATTVVSSQAMQTTSPSGPSTAWSDFSQPSIDTTADKDLVVTATWSAASLSNQAVLKQIVVDIT